jgi:hypothetical protein
MKITQLRHFVAVAEDLHFPIAAERLGISRQKLNSSVESVEAEFGAPLINRSTPTTTLTAAGKNFLIEARELIAEDETRNPPQPKKAGGKAKASKGVGRAPAVKGQPMPGRRRQGR